MVAQKLAYLAQVFAICIKTEIILDFFLFLLFFFKLNFLIVFARENQHFEGLLKVLM